MKPYQANNYWGLIAYQVSGAKWIKMVWDVAFNYLILELFLSIKLEHKHFKTSVFVQELATNT